MLSLETAVDICPERMDAADAEVPRPPRIKTVVEFCPRMAVESMETEEFGKIGTAVLTMRRFWCTRKNIQDKTLLLLFFLPESLYVRVEAVVDNCPERMDAAVEV